MSFDLKFLLDNAMAFKVEPIRTRTAATPSGLERPWAYWERSHKPILHPPKSFSFPSAKVVLLLEDSASFRTLIPTFSTPSTRWCGFLWSKNRRGSQLAIVLYFTMTILQMKAAVILSVTSNFILWSLSTSSWASQKVNHRDFKGKNPRQNATTDMI